MVAERPFGAVALVHEGVVGDLADQVVAGADPALGEQLDEVEEDLRVRVGAHLVVRGVEGVGGQGPDPGPVGARDAHHGADDPVGQLLGEVDEVQFVAFGGLGHQLADHFLDHRLQARHLLRSESLVEGPLEPGVVGDVGDDEHALGDGGDGRRVAAQAHPARRAEGVAVGVDLHDVAVAGQRPEAPVPAAGLGVPVDGRVGAQPGEGGPEVVAAEGARVEQVDLHLRLLAG